MPVFRMTLLGPPEMTWAGETLPIPRRQTRALLYRLATQMVPIAREQLCFLFWPDSPDAVARRNLTHLLTHVRRVLPWPELLCASDDGVGLDAREVWCDAVVFDRLTATADAAARPAALQQAADLVHGPFLSGFSLPGCPEFESWLDGERAARERRYLDTLAAVVEIATAQGDYVAALAAAQCYLETDELAEDIHRRLIALYAASGDRGAALRQFERCVVVLEREMGVSPLAETYAVYEAVRAGSLPLAPSARALSAATGAIACEAKDVGPVAADLPASTGPLIGRAAEMADVTALLRRPDVRLLTLSGPGGAGKTRLALEAVRAIADHYVDGAAFVPLAPLRDPALVVPAIAEALGLADQSTRPALARLQDTLRDREMLLLLDNFEHVLSAARDVAALLEAAPGLTVLATSRAILRLRGEHVYGVPPLALPDPANLPPPDQLAQMGSVALFLARVRARLPSFQLGAANAREVAGICAHLDGLPLAIELAAARAALLSPRMLLARLDRRLALLDDGPRDLPERQRTLRAAIDWSYELLDVGPQLLLGRLAVFAGGWTLEAAETVSAAVGPTAQTVLDGLQALLDNHLVQRTAGVDGEPRFGMLETIREYALERLTERGEALAAQQAHAHYFLGFAERAAEALHGPEQIAWFDRLEEEHANLRVALEQFLASDAAADALRLAYALHWFWHVRGHLTEGRRWLERALALAVTRTDVEPRVLGRARTAAGMLAFDQGDLEAASAHCEHAVPLWRALLSRDDAEQEARRFLTLTFGIWSAPLHARGDSRLPAIMAELFALLPALDDPHLQATSTIRYGQRVLESGAVAAAKPMLREGLAMFRTLGDTLGIAEAEIALGAVALWEADVVSARSYFAKALDLAQAIGDRAMQAWALNNLGEAARLGGDDAAAAEHYTASLQLYRDIDNRGDSPRLLHNLGYVALHTGDLELARARFGASLAEFRASGVLRGMVEAVVGFAAVAAATGTDAGARLAAELWGAADAANLVEGILVWPADHAERERYETMARTVAGGHAFDAAYTRGSTLAIEQAIATALAV